MWTSDAWLSLSRDAYGRVVVGIRCLSPMSVTRFHAHRVSDMVHGVFLHCPILPLSPDRPDIPPDRRPLIAALSRTAEMVGLLLDALDVLLVSSVAGQQPSAGDVERLTEHSALWRQQLEKLRSRLASLDQPPTRPQ